MEEQERAKREAQNRDENWARHAAAQSKRLGYLPWGEARCSRIRSIPIAED